MTPRDLADRVRELREERGLTQAELAKRTDYHPSTISRAESFEQGDGFTGIRISIIEELTGKTVEGPLYRETT